MEFKELQARVLRRAEKYSQHYGVTIDQDFAVLKLCEEAGEFAQALLIARNKCRPDKVRAEAEARAALAHELADIIGMAIINAHLLGIDLEEAMNGKWLSDEV
jgi:NTP pyrophosphatase (non-canonical NTP hydrolase)